jgi:hypothetical protein
MRRYFYPAIAASLLVSVSASKLRGSERFDVGGYFKHFSVVHDNHGLKGFISNRIRLYGHLRVADWLAFNGAYDFAPYIQDPALSHNEAFRIETAPESYRAVDLDDRLYPAPGDSVRSFAVLQNLDRTFFTITAPQFDLYVGRQAIAWGSGHVINPTDVIAPYTYGELDTEDRIGVDAVRLRVPIGFMGEIDAGYVFGDEFEFSQSAFFIRGKFYAARTDWSVLLVGFRENLLVGLDLTRDVGGAGFWMEGGYVFVDALNENRVDGNGDYFRASIGLDHSLWRDAYGFAEYHFNGAGADDAKGYLDNLASLAYTEGSVYLLGKHYLVPGVSCQITPLLTASSEALLNLSDPSVFLAPNLEYNIAQDIYIAAGTYVGIGRRPEAVMLEGLGSTRVSFRSEFGSYPDSYYGSFRIYF